MPNDNNPAAPSGDVTELVAVAPQGGATVVSLNTTPTMQFSGPMGTGMEQFVDFHDGTTAGPVHPMNCAWSTDLTKLSCTPTTPLQAQTTYTLHMGAGMVAAGGSAVDMTPGTGMGGQWLVGGMMGGQHAGQPMSMMGGNWAGSNGSYGMMFTFTTG